MSVLEHLVNYIKDLSMSTKDLIEEFNEGLIKCDPFLMELGEEFSGMIKKLYFDRIIILMNKTFQKILNTRDSVSSQEEKGNLIFKTFYNIVILFFVQIYR